MIALTGKRNGDLKRWMLTLGVEHYLHKPLRFGKILDAIRKYLDLRPRRDQPAESPGTCGDVERINPRDPVVETSMGQFPTGDRQSPS